MTAEEMFFQKRLIMKMIPVMLEKRNGLMTGMEK